MQKAKDLVTWWSNFLSFFSLKAIRKFITDVKPKFPFSRRTYKVKKQVSPSLYGFIMIYHIFELMIVT
jgi:hypothetical protein